MLTITPRVAPPFSMTAWKKAEGMRLARLTDTSVDLIIMCETGNKRGQVSARGHNMEPVY